MVTEIKISPEYRDSIHKYTDEQIDALTVPIEIPWEPSAAARIEKHPDAHFILCVHSMRDMAAAAERLSQGMTFSVVTLENGRMALFSAGDKKWRDIAIGLGPVGTRGLILRLVTKAVRRGKDIRAILPVVESILLDGARPLDAEILVQAWKLK